MSRLPLLMLAGLAVTWISSCTSSRPEGRHEQISQGSEFKPDFRDYLFVGKPFPHGRKYLLTDSEAMRLKTIFQHAEFEVSQFADPGPRVCFVMLGGKNYAFYPSGTMFGHILPKDQHHRLNIALKAIFLSKKIPFDASSDFKSLDSN